MNGKQAADERVEQAAHEWMKQAVHEWDEACSPRADEASSPRADAASSPRVGAASISLPGFNTAPKHIAELRHGPQNPWRSFDMAPKTHYGASTWPPELIAEHQYATYMKQHWSLPT